MKLPFLIPLLISAASCRTFTPPAEEQELSNSTHWLTYDATRRAGFVFPADSGERVLSEPAPDVALQSTTKLLAKVDGDELGVDVQEQIVELGKRTSSVMILREALYRLSEMQINGVLTPEAQDLYKEVIEAVRLIAVAEAASALSDLEADAQGAFVGLLP